jgi:hypothetical protein
VIGRYTPGSSALPKISPVIREHVPWVVRQINDWRRRAEGIHGRRDRRELHPETFGDGVAALLHAGGLDDAGVELVIYTVLSCEWLFRFKRLLRDDELRDRLRETFGRSASAIRLVPSREYDWVLAGDVEPAEVRSFGYQSLGTYGFSDRDCAAFIPGEERHAAIPILSKRRGTLPLPGPFVAGVLIEMLLGQSSRVGATALALRFVQSLKDNADEKTFREYRRRMASPSGFVRLSVADDLFRDIRDLFALHRKDSSRADVLRVVRGKFQIFDGRAVFPRNDDAVLRICGR